MSRAPDTARLLRWYDAEKRDLPWRRQPDPYRIWVSEIMLQQTRTATVVPYYERFVERFPSIEALATAQPDEVLATWSGLGYYARARRLHRAARELVRAGAGLPRSAVELERLPGVGPYTAAAVASIAFGEAVPVLDGNVMRVLGRRLALRGDPRRAEAQRQLKREALKLLDDERPGDCNQALMELGARVCMPRQANCPQCPLRQGCRAAASGEPTRYPQIPAAGEPEKISRAVALVRLDERLLLFRRSECARILPGMWELPWAEPDAQGEAARALAARYGGRWRTGPALGQVRHQISKRAFEIEIRPAWLEADDWLAEGPEAGWFSLPQLERLPLTSLVRKVLARVGAARAPV